MTRTLNFYIELRETFPIYLTGCELSPIRIQWLKVLPKGSWPGQWGVAPGSQGGVLTPRISAVGNWFWWPPGTLAVNYSDLICNRDLISCMQVQEKWAIDLPPLGPWWGQAQKSFFCILGITAPHLKIRQSDWPPLGLAAIFSGSVSHSNLPFGTVRYQK